jgi:pimeloyl-ACP methyl ester carboxylesterase
MKTSVTCKKGVLKTQRFLISYRIYGNSGPQLIFINGVQQSMGMWQTLVSRFAPNYRIVLFDFPEHGKSNIISGPSTVTLDEQVQILLAVMKETGINSDATICAASWGGVIAVAFAVKYPDKAKRLILASLGTKPNKKMVETIKNGAGVAMGDREEMAQILLKSFGETLPSRIKQNIVNQFRNMREDKVKAFYEHGLFVISSKRLDEVVDLGKIKAKTILINGENDAIIDLDDVKFLASKIPNCELKILKNVGHFLHMESESVIDVYEDIISSP